jgi:hypothetical protein
MLTVGGFTIDVSYLLVAEIVAVMWLARLEFRTKQNMDDNKDHKKEFAALDNFVKVQILTSLNKIEVKLGIIEGLEKAKQERHNTNA